MAFRVQQMTGLYLRTLASISVEKISDHFSSSNSMSSGDLNESILTLKILAKFLALVESLPYQYREDPHTDKLMQACSKYRQKVSCIFH